MLYMYVFYIVCIHCRCDTVMICCDKVYLSVPYKIEHSSCLVGVLCRCMDDPDFWFCWCSETIQCFSCWWYVDLL